MRTLSLYGLLVGLILLGSSCENQRNCVNPSGPEETRQFSLPELRGITLSIPAELIIRRDTVQNLSLTGPATLLDNLSTRVIDRVWEVTVPGCVKDYDRLIVEASLLQVEELGISGSGEINTADSLSGGRLDIAISGSGEVNMDLVYDQVNIAVSGAADIKMTGEADVLDYGLSGSGNLRAFGLNTRESFIAISGSGNVDITATELLDIAISGSGTVRYKGKPTLRQSISGSGTVIDAN